MIIFKKILMLFFLAASVAATYDLQASMSDGLFGHTKQAQLGTQPASQWYQEKMHEFLSFLGIKNHDSIKINNLAAQFNSEGKRNYVKLSPSCIGLNEQDFEGLDEPIKLWYLAVIAARYTSQESPYKKALKNSLLYALKAAPAVLYGALLAYGSHHYSTIFIPRQRLSPGQQRGLGIFTGLAAAANGLYASIATMEICKTSQKIVNSHTKTTIEKVDLKAAHMLCENGYQYVVETRIDQLSGDLFERAVDLPSAEEERAYLQEFLAKRAPNPLPVAATHNPKPIVDPSAPKQPASQWYQDKAHEFLHNFGIKNADSIKVYKLDETNHSHAKSTLGYCSGFDIGINETLLEVKPVQQKLFTTAHEAAHYALAHHARFNRAERSLFMRMTSSIPVCGLSLTLLLNRYCKNLIPSLFIGAGVGLVTGIYTINRWTNNLPNLKKISKIHEKEADLAAVQMLCEHGYKADAEAFIKIESDHLAKGYEASDDWRPSLKEQVDYLQKFLVTRTSV